ncbi:serine-rich and transmembrane domain-containing 2-like [Narcine bancroftii]|uniref:serine-rich and transmembrane domain-containing 2-like n=1 Tax=Narcine bancroftii TaxID=1343680 RepID=UPI003831FD46
MTEFYFRQPGNFTTGMFHLPTVATVVEDSMDNPSNIYTYVAIFFSLLVLLLVITIIVLYRLKHVIVPVSSPVDSVGKADVFTSMQVIDF